MLIMPVIVLFFQDNGLTMKEILLLQAIFSVAIVVFEVPSGYFADRFDRKVSIVIGTICGFLGYVVYATSYGFWGFLIAELTLGLGSSFISGADSAMVYDTLSQTKRKDDFKKVEGRRLAIGNFSEGFASIVGGLLATISLRFPLYVEVVLMAVTIPLALSLVEPKRTKLVDKENPFKQILKIVKYSLHDHGEIKWLIMYSSLIGASTLTMVWFIQPYLKQAGLPLALFGIVWAVLNFSVGIFSWTAHRVEGFMGRRKSLIMLIFLGGLGYLMVGMFKSLWGAPFLLIFYFVRGINGPVVKDYVNKIISSDIRATVLSVKNLVGRLIFSIIGPVIGWVTDVFSLQTALFSAGLTFFILGIISLIFLHKNKGL
jgi:MFS family permease